MSHAPEYLESNLFEFAQGKLFGRADGWGTLDEGWNGMRVPQGRRREDERAGEGE